MARKPIPKMRIADIDQPDMKITVQGTVSDAYGDAHESIRQKGTITDATGSCEFVLWEKSAMAGTPELVNDHVYRLEGVYTKEFRGDYSVSLVKTTNVVDITDQPRGQQKLGEVGGE